MKNTKITKIFVFVIALALLIGSAVGIAISANESPTPNIIGINVQYGADLRFMVAVDSAELGADKTVTVNIYDETPADGVSPVSSVTAVYTDTSGTNLGVDAAYVAVSGYGISAIAMGQSFYITAECDGVTSEVHEYSAVGYFLERLYGDGIINATEGDDLTRKEHYQNTIRYGSTAQKVVGDTKPNVADYLYVAAQDGTVNGASGAIVLKGDALEFAYTGAEDASGIAYWLDPTGAKTAVASVSGTYTPKFADFTFGDLSNDTTITLSTSSGFRAGTLADGDKDVSKYKDLIYSYPAATGRDQAFTIEDGALKHSSTTGGVEFGLYNANNYESNYNYTNFESDIKIVVPDGATQRVITTQLRLGTSNERYRIILTYNTNGRLYVKFQIKNYWASSGYYSLSDTAVTVAAEGSQTAEFNLRFESVYIAETNDSAAAVYVNGAAVMIADSRAYSDDLPAIPESSADIKMYKNTDGVCICKLGHMSLSNTDASIQDGVFRMIYFNPNSGNSCDIYFDNIIFESKALSADEIPVYNITPES